MKNCFESLDERRARWLETSVFAFALVLKDRDGLDASGTPNDILSDWLNTLVLYDFDSIGHGDILWGRFDVMV